MVHSLGNGLAYTHCYWIIKLEDDFAKLIFMLIESPLSYVFLFSFSLSVGKNSIFKDQVN